MKTIIFNGSPRKNGDTVTLISEFKKYIKGDVKIISACFDNISHCMDCRYCWNKTGCSINDDMQEVYNYLEVCDNVVIASPIWFSELSGPMLNLASRFQTYFTSHVFRNEKKIKQKNGVLILVGAEIGTEKKAISTANTIFKHINALPCVATVLSLDTNEVSAKKDLQALEDTKKAANILNHLYFDKV